MKLEQYEQLFDNIKQLIQLEITDSECLSLINDRLTEFDFIKSQEISFDTIEARVCSYTGVTKDELHIKTSKHEIVFARQLCYFISKRNRLGSYKTIAYRFGKKDHATAMHGCTTISNLIDVDAKFKADYLPLLTHFQITL